MLDVMIFGFYLGEHIIVVIGVLLAIYFVYKRYWPELVMVVIAWAGEGAIWLYSSNYFNRPRPAFPQEVWHTMTAPGFPSGHVIAAVMCFCLLAYWAMPHLSSRLSKALVWLVAVAIILYIGFSRLFIGDHFLTDVLAGYALGIAWFGLVFTSVELITQKRKKQT
jgi:undecaprenyl-diphosphatase